MAHRGLLGCPGDIYSYAPGMGWGPMNLVISLGALLFAIGVLLLVINIVVSLRRGTSQDQIPGAAHPWSGRSPRRRHPTTSP